MLLIAKIGWLETFADAACERIVSAGKDPYPARLKLKHGLLVLSEAEYILNHEPWAAAAPVWLTEAIRLAALFHDVGRFPQYERHGTFDDRRSENHGGLGCKVLLTTDALSDLLAGPLTNLRADPRIGRRMAATIRGATLLHNRLRLPDGLDPDVRRATQVVRDADKLDIFRVMMEAFRTDGPVNKVVALGLAEHPDARTPAIVEAIRGRRLARYEDMVWINDFKMLLMSWAYDLTHASAAGRLLELDYVTELQAMLPDDGLTRELADQVRDDLRRATVG